MSDPGVSPVAPARSSAVMTGAQTPACPNCQSPTVDSFCAECGERQPSRADFSIRGLLGDAFHEVTSIDSRLLKSIIALLSEPGLLTREWFEGRRGRYVKPLSLFIMLNVAFFIIQPHTGLLSYKYQNYVYGTSPAARHRVSLIERRRAQTRDTPEQFEARFNATLQDQKKTLLIFDIPVVAMTLALLYAWRRRFFAEHLVFSVHAYAFLLVFLGTMVPLLYLVVMPGLLALGASRDIMRWFDGERGISILLAIVMGSYLYLALRRVYGDRPVAAILRAAIVFVVIGQLTGVYHDVLFYTTLYLL